MRYLPGVELDGETTRISNGFGAPPFMNDGGETNDDRSLDTRCPEEVGTGEVSDIVSAFEEALGTGTPGMNNTLWNALPGKMRDLFDQMVVLQENGSCQMEINQMQGMCT